MKKMRPFMSNQGLDPSIEEDQEEEIKHIEINTIKPFGVDLPTGKSLLAITYDISGMSFTEKNPFNVLDNIDNAVITGITDPSYVRIGEDSYTLPSIIDDHSMYVSSVGGEIRLNFAGDLTINEGFISILFYQNNDQGN